MGLESSSRLAEALSGSRTVYRPEASRECVDTKLVSHSNFSGVRRLAGVMLTSSCNQNFARSSCRSWSTETVYDVAVGGDGTTSIGPRIIQPNSVRCAIGS